MLQVSRQGYFQWLKRQEAVQEEEDRQLQQEIARIHQASKATYGTPRIKAELERQGQRVSRRRIGRLMKKADLKTRCKRKFRVTTQSKAGQKVFENVLDRDFTASKTNQKWACDITYLPTREGWLYFSVVLDVFSRKVIGWAFSTRLEVELALKALQMARERRGEVTGVLHHSDRGVQYTCEAYQQALQSLQATCSMSRKGNCWDNAVVESFFATLKLELALHRSIGNREETCRTVFSWVEGWYNRRRLHSSLGFCSPVEFEEQQCG